jgi:hypothetical protein
MDKKTGRSKDKYLNPACSPHILSMQRAFSKQVNVANAEAVGKKRLSRSCTMSGMDKYFIPSQQNDPGLCKCK